MQLRDHPRLLETCSQYPLTAIYLAISLWVTFLVSTLESLLS